MSKLDDVREILATDPDAVPLMFEGQVFPCLPMTHDDPGPGVSQGPRTMDRNAFVQCCAADLPNLKQGGQVYVDGVEWRAAKVALIQEGLMMEIYLGEPRDY